MRSRLYEIAFVRGAFVVVAALALYLWLAPEFFVNGDNAELVAIGARGGVPHPSGYPLYVLWLRAMAWLPGATPAQTAAFATAILAAAALLALHAACRAWGASPAAASFAIAIYAAGPIVLRVSSEAEVFALNGLIVALVLWLAAARGPARGAWRAVLLALVAGLGLCNHMTCMLVAPVGLLGVARGLRETSRAKPIVIAAAVGAFALGLLPYAYLLVAPDNELSWRHIDSLHALWRHVLRMDYGGPGAFAAKFAPVPIAISLRAFADALARGWLWAPLVLGLAVFAVACVRPAVLAGDREPHASLEPRVGWWALAAAFAIAGPILISRFNIEPVGSGKAACERFYLLPMLLLAIPIAVGFDAIAARVRMRHRGSLLRALPVQTAIAIAGLAAAAAPSLARISGIHSPAVEHAVLNILRSLPPNAVIITSSDELNSGFAYEQDVLGERPDVTAVTWSLMQLPFYRERIARHGLTFPDKVVGPASVAFAAHAMAQGRPVIIDRGSAAIAQAFATYPWGPMFRVQAAGSTPLSLDDIIAVNRTIYAAYDLAYPKPGPDDAFATEEHHEYALVWFRLADALANVGRLADAGWAQNLARQLAPEP